MIPSSGQMRRPDDPDDRFHCASLTLRTNDPTDQTLLTRFPGVYIDDSTTLGLPRALLPLFPGTGGRGGPTAAVKVPLRLELRRGVVELSDLQAGRSCDLASPLPHGPLPAGSLRLADLALISTVPNSPNISPAFA